MKWNDLRRASILERITSLMADLGYDELCVIYQATRGLKQGKTDYGDLNLDNDPRDWLTELEAEMRDSINYAAMKLVKMDRLKKREALEKISELGQEEEQKQLELFKEGFEPNE